MGYSFFFVICCTYNSMRYTHDVHLFSLSLSLCLFLSLSLLPSFVSFFFPYPLFLFFSVIFLHVRMPFPNNDPLPKQTNKKINKKLHKQNCVIYSIGSATNFFK